MTAILQYDPAGEPSEYVHRVGRTARLGQGGEALMLLLPSERGYIDLMAQRGVALRVRLPPAGGGGGGCLGKGSCCHEPGLKVWVRRPGVGACFEPIAEASSAYIR